jgi:Ni2+-binding GTPase involved in maturation of urease and hydrogenase
MGSVPSHKLTTFEQEAELLVVDQLDLLAQLERQLRAVHRTMRQIEQLRRGKSLELSSGQKSRALDHLTEELGAIDHELNTQHESCQQMLSTVEKMRGRLRQLRQPSSGASQEPASPAES